MVVLADLIQKDQWKREVLRQTLEKSVLWNSGLIVNDAELTKMMQANVGTSFEFDYFNDIGDDEANLSDDSNTKVGTKKITTGKERATASFRNQAWGEKSITKNLSATGDALAAITGRVGAYWGRQMDRTTIAIINGIIADNIANNASDMVNGQTGKSIDIGMILDTIQTAGDASDMLGGMITHSAIRTKLKKDGVTDKIYSDKGIYLYEALAGLRLLITDTTPSGTKIPSGAAGDYLSYIVGTSALGYGEGTPEMPTELVRDGKSGNGGGETSLINRKHFAIHPYGFDFQSASVAGLTPTNAEYEDVANWKRKAHRKRVPIAALIATA